MPRSDIASLRAIIQRAVTRQKPSRYLVPLSEPTFGVDEILEAIDSLTSGQVTYGTKVRAFESAFAQYCGCAGAVSSNSGSSANLLALMAVLESESARRDNRRSGGKVLVPAVSWSTSVFPILDAGLIPVLVDIDLATLNADASTFEAGIDDDVVGLIPVHLLGNPAPMDSIMKLAEEHDLFVMEDACEAHGATVHDKRVGSWGDCGTFSFYFSHHISTIEGGMVVSDDEELLDLVKVLRSHGLARDSKHLETHAAMNPRIDPRFLFVNRGFNLRPTEIQGAFGIHQLKKLEGFIETRRQNAHALRKRLEPFSDWLLFQDELASHRNVYLAFSVILREDSLLDRGDLTASLERAGIETRPIVAGNLAEQPAFKHLPHETAGKLPNSRLVMRNGFYFGIHQGVGPKQLDLIAAVFEDFFRQQGLPIRS
jgi:CDP-6-deoxy-D-xylo-4-hexulose-3-dehydrase